MNQKEKHSFGMIGLGTMGSNLLQNIADHGYSCSGYDIDPKKVHQLNQLNPNFIHGFSTLGEFVESLQSPKIVMILVPAGEIVQHVIDDLVEILDKGDIIIDGGNSHYTDTELRFETLEEKGFHFVGMGVSGGEEGARFGPSMMPGGDIKAYKVIKPILEKIAAHVDGVPTVAFMGERSAGHFVKMVHNGIEYAIMQLISEIYDVLKKGLKYSDAEIHTVFTKWSEGRLSSYLLDITRDIFAFRNEGDENILLHIIRDQAKAKGTGKWTSQAAMDLSVPIPIIDIAVAMRNLSTFKSLRIDASEIYTHPQVIEDSEKEKDYIVLLEQAFYFGMVSAYAQGMHLLFKSSTEFNYDLNLETISKVWRGGCIIRSEFLKDMYKAYQNNPDLQHLFLDESIQISIEKSLPCTRIIVSDAIRQGIAVPALSVSLSYFDNFRSEEMPTNLIQAQRDYFGSHTYEVKGKKGVFHTKWIMENKDSN